MKHNLRLISKFFSGARQLLFVLLALLTLPAWGQQSDMEALRKQLKTEKVDTSRIHLMGDLARMLVLNADSTEALKLLNEALVLCKKQNYDYGYGHIYNALGVYYDEISQYNQAEHYYQLSYDYFKKSPKENAKLGVATALGNLGLMAQYKGDIEKAINYKLQSLDGWKATNYPEKAIAVGNIYASIAGLYSKVGQLEKAIFYDKKGIETRLQANKKDADLGTNYIFLIDDFTKNKQLDSAHKYMVIVKNLIDELKNPVLYMRYYGSSAKISFEEKNYNNSLENSFLMLKYAKETQKSFQEMNANLLIGRCYQQLKQAQKAIPFLKNVLAIAPKVNGTESRKNALLELSNAYHQLNNNTEAFAYLTQYTALKDSLNANEIKLKLNDIDTKYQTVQKEKQILVLEQQKQKQKTLIYSLIAGFLVVALLGFLGYRNLSNHRKIAEQQVILKEIEVQQLQQERQLVATNSILKGQEDERTRVARDLHDGLGGLLTGIKLTLNKVKGNVILPESGALAFTRALSQLDSAINEMRRVAHSMMPEALVRYGLPDALSDFCSDLNESGQMKVRLQLLGMDERLDSSVEVVLYRIVQELLNNVLKHAQATEAYVQITRTGTTLSLTVEDNGKGFDIGQLNQNKGAGMRNIENRVAYLNGKMDIQSKPNEGTSVYIELQNS